MENFEEIDEGNLKEGNEADAEGKVKEPAFLPFPEEAKGDGNLIYRVGVRLPDGRRVQRNFLRIDPLQVSDMEQEREGEGEDVEGSREALHGLHGPKPKPLIVYQRRRPEA